MNSSPKGTAASCWCLSYFWKQFGWEKGVSCHTWVTENSPSDICVHVPSGLSESSVFPSCAVTRAQARQLGDVVDISDTLLKEPDTLVGPSPEIKKQNNCFILSDSSLINLSNLIILCLPACLLPRSKPVSYLFDPCVLLYKWFSVSGMEYDVVTQVVMPKEYRLQV